MSKERILFDAIGTYLDKQAVDKSAMPFPKGQDRYGLPKKEDSWGGLKDLRRGVEAIRVGASRVNPKSEEPSDVQKAKPKVLKPGTPEHDRAMAEMEAAKAGKPKSTNPAGVESPSAPGSRDKLGDRPLVGGLDKDFGAPPRKSLTQAERNAIPELGWDTGTQGHNPTKQNFRRCVGEDCKTGFKYEHGGPASKPLECPHCGKVQDRYLDKAIENVVEQGAWWDKPGPDNVQDRKKREAEQRAKDAAEGKGIVVTDHSVKKSMDLDEPSRSWSYQG